MTVIGQLLSTIWWATILYFVLLFLTVPIGMLLIRSIRLPLPKQMQLLTAIPFGAILVSGVTTVARMVGVPAGVVQVTVFALCGVASAQLITQSNCDLWRRWHEELWGLVGVWLFGLLCIIGAAFPNGKPEDLMVHVVMGLTSLPTDAIIPYLVARHIVEGVSFGAAQVLPNWNVTDRPPFASMIVSAVFTVTGISDSGPLYGATRGVYFVGHVIEVYLNALPILALWLVGSCYFIKRHGAAAVLLGCSTSFFYENVIFTWPKMLAAYLLLLGLVLVFFERRFIVAGIILGLAALSHGVALFYVIALFGLWFCKIAFQQLFRSAEQHQALSARLLEPCYCGGAYLLMLSPWKLLCWMYPPSPRLSLLHFFCDMSQELDKKVFSEEFVRYFSDHSLQDLLMIRWSNVLYPFNMQPLVTAWNVAAGDLLRVLDSISGEAFFRLVWSVGPLMFVLAIWGLLTTKTREPGSSLWPFAGVGGIAFAIAVVTFGCANWALNHHWGYGVHLILPLLAAGAVARGSLLALACFAVTFCINAFWLIYYGLLKCEIKPFVFASTGTLITQAVLLFLFCLLFAIPFCSEEGTRLVKST